jgi:hypothetical protein
MAGFRVERTHEADAFFLCCFPEPLGIALGDQGVTVDRCEYRSDGVHRRLPLQVFSQQNLATSHTFIFLWDALFDYSTS